VHPGGSTYISCYSEEDGSGPKGGAFRTTKDNAGFSTFLGCSFESNQSQLWPGTIMIGGLHQGRVLKDPDPSKSGHYPLEPVNEPDVLEGGWFASLGESLMVRGAIATRTVFPTATGFPVNIGIDDSIVLADATHAALPLILPPLDTRSALDGIDSKFNFLRIIGRVYTIKRVDDGRSPNAVTVSPPAGARETIDGQQSIPLAEPFSWVKLVATARVQGQDLLTNWYVIGRGASPPPH
jgi:hypothetical protein